MVYLQHHSIFTIVRKRADNGCVEELEFQVQLLRDEIRRLHNLNPTTARSSQIEHLMVKSQDAIDNDPTDPSLTYVDAESDQREETEYVGDSTASDDISSLMWRLTVEDNGETSFIGPSGNFCFPSDERIPMRNKVTAAPDERPAMPEYDDPLVVNDLVHLFMTYINPVHQFINASVANRVIDGSRDKRDLLRCAVLAAAAVFSQEPEMKSYGEAVSGIVEQEALSICRQRPSLEIVQALSIMCWRELGLDHANMAWMYNCASDKPTQLIRVLDSALPNANMR